jgi:hypothetical protein
MINLPLIIYYTAINLPAIEYRRTLYIITVALEFVLMICHFWWFAKIVRGITSAVMKGPEELKDTRSDHSD